MARNQHRPQLIRRVTMGNMTALPSGKTTLGKQIDSCRDVRVWHDDDHPDSHIEGRFDVRL